VFDRVTIRVSDREVSERFYEAVLAAVDIARTGEGAGETRWGTFAVAPAADAGSVTRRLHVAFPAPSRAKVDEFWQIGVAAGYRDDGAPGPRPQYTPDYYGAFLLDPDGNSAEAVHHAEDRRGAIDHLWLRIADLDASTAFYAAVALYTGFMPSERVETAFTSQVPRRHSQSSSAHRPSTFTWRSRPRTPRRSTHFIVRRPTQATATAADLARASSATRATRHASSSRTATPSPSSSLARDERRAVQARTPRPAPRARRLGRDARPEGRRLGRSVELRVRRLAELDEALVEQLRPPDALPRANGRVAQPVPGLAFAAPRREVNRLRVDDAVPARGRRDDNGVAGRPPECRVVIHRLHDVLETP
jgi:catechol 2,3-dioxygenase-like lactoylglutathione lyase family enzyme